MCSKVQNQITVQRAKVPHCGFTDTEKWISNHIPTWNTMHPKAKIKAILSKSTFKTLILLIDYHGIEANYF